MMSPINQPSIQDALGTYSRRHIKVSTTRLLHIREITHPPQNVSQTITLAHFFRLDVDAEEGEKCEIEQDRLAGKDRLNLDCRE